MIHHFKKVFRSSEKAGRNAKIAFEAVEPRVLFSATPVDSIETPDGVHHSLPVIHEEAPARVPVPTGAPDGGVPQIVDGDGALLLEGLNDYAAELASEGRREIVFISTDVSGYEYIVSHLDPSYEVFLINAHSDGIAQIAGALAGTTGVDAIHLLTHGSEGRLFPGGTEFNAETMQNEHRIWLEAIRDALSDDADFLIYGCDFTSGEEGLAAAELLSTILGADIAASTDSTGHADFGGNWDLETEIGLIESEMLSIEGWNGLLAPISIVNTNDATTLANNVIGGGITLGRRPIPVLPSRRAPLPVRPDTLRNGSVTRAVSSSRPVLQARSPDRTPREELRSMRPAREITPTWPHSVAELRLMLLF